jgi:hypothetical protein
MGKQNWRDFVKGKKPPTKNHTKSKKTTVDKTDPFIPNIPIFPGEESKTPRKKKKTTGGKGNGKTFDDMVRFLE